MPDFEMTFGLEDDSPVNLESFSDLENILSKKPSRFSPLTRQANINRNLAIDKNPETEARAVKLAEQTGWPLQVVRSDMAGAQTQAEKVPDAELDPAILNFVSRLPENAAIIKDDTRKVNEVVSVWTLLNQYYEGLKRDAAAAYTSGRAGRDVNFLSYDKYINDTPGLDEQIGRLEQEIKRPERTDLLGQVITASAEQLPIQFDLIPAGLIGAMTGASAAAVAGLIGGVPGVVAGVLAGGGLGFQLSVAQRAYFMEAGGAAREYSNFVDEDGSKLDPFVLKNAAVLAGVLNAGMETIGQTALLKLAPGLKNIVSLGAKRVVKDALKKKAFREALRKITVDYGAVLGVETATEMIQELTTIGVGEVIKEIEFETPKHLTKAQIFERVGDAGRQAFLATLGLGSVGASARITLEGAKAARGASFYEEQLKLKDAIEDTKLQTRAPTKMKEVLETAGMDSEVFISGEALQNFKENENSEAIFNKLGISDESINEAFTTGQDINLKLSDVQTQLTREESESFFQIMRESPESKSLLESREFNPLEETQTILEADRALFREINEFTAERSRLESEVLDVAQKSKLPEPKEYAENVSELWAAFAERISQESDQTAAETLRRIRTEPATFADVREAQTFIETNELQETIPAGVTKIAPEGYVISLFEDANVSTLLHESGHVFLNEILTLDNLGKASENLKADVSIVKEWLEVDDKTGVTRKQQDKFAAGFERYLREGKAPSSQLRKAFERFRDWLMSVYRTIAASPLDVKLTDEVKGVFDRLLAAEQDSFKFIQDNSFQITDGEIKKLNLSKKEQKLWSRVISGATESAKKDIQRRQAKEYRANIKTWRTEAEIQIAGRRVNNVLTDLTSSKRGFDLSSSAQYLSAQQLNLLDAKMPDIFAHMGFDPKIITDRFGYASIESMFKELGETPPLNEQLKKAKNENEKIEIKNLPVNQLRLFLANPVFGLDKALMEEQFGKQITVRLKAKHIRLVKNNGQSPFTVAAEYGYSDANEMVSELLNTPSKKDQITNLVNEKEKQHYLNFTAEDSFLNWNNDLAKYFDFLGKFLSRKTGIESSVSPKDIKNYVNREFQDFLVKDAARTDRYLWTMKRALKAKDKALKKGDFQEAFNQAQQARLSFEYARRTKKLKEDTGKLKRLSQNAFKAKGRIEFEYWKNIVSLANRFKLIKTKLPKEVKTLNSILAENKSLMDNGAEFSDWLVNGTDEKRFQDLKVSNFTEVDNLIRMLNHIGRAKTDQRNVLSQARMDVLAQDLKTPVTQLKGLKNWAEGSALRKISDTKRQIIAHLDTFHNVVLWLDAFQNVGPEGTPGLWERQIYQPLTKADSEQLRINQDLRRRLKPAFDQLNRSFQKYPKIITDIKVPIPQKLADMRRSWTFETVVSIALNRGNRGNAQALKDGYGLSENDLNEITKILTDEDWDAIQSIWDSLNAYREPLFQTRERMVGFQPEKVEADSFVAPTGKTMKGGYYPLKEDREVSGGKSPAWTDEEDLILTSNAAFGIGVPAGALKERKGFGGRPVRLSLGVLAQHLDFIAKYISHAEVLRDVDRLLRNPDLALEIDRKLGPEARRNMRATLQNIARDNNQQLDVIDRFFLGVRRLSTLFILGANVSVALKQIFSLGGFARKYRFSVLIDGIKELTKNAVTGGFMKTLDTVTKLSPFMRGRFNNLDVNINRAVNTQITKKHILPGVPFSLQDIRDSMFILIKIADFAAVMPAWMGAFNEGKRRFKGDVDQAVNFADTAIRTTQPSTRPIDLTPIQQSRKGMAQAVTMFSTFTLLFGNIQRTEFRALREGKISKRQFARSVLWNFIIPPVAMTTMFAALRGELPEPKEIALDFLAYQAVGIPVVRDLAFGAANVAKGKRFFASGYDSPIFTPFDLADTANRALIGFVQNAGNEKKQDEALWAFCELASFGAGIPVTAIYRQMKQGMQKVEKLTE
jgi:hypothetical protein